LPEGLGLSRSPSKPATVRSRGGCWSGQRRPLVAHRDVFAIWLTSASDGIERSRRRCGPAEHFFFRSVLLNCSAP
jgi:hypothetical protein